MNNTLTAKEWLEKETNTENTARSGSDMALILGKECHDFMERYADYKNKVLIDTYDKYIRLLSSELNKVASLQITHPHLVEKYTEESEVVVKGKNLRQKIKDLKGYFNIQNNTKE